MINDVGARCFFFQLFLPQVGAFELGQNFEKSKKLGHSSWGKFLKNQKVGAFELGQNFEKSKSWGIRVGAKF